MAFKALARVALGVMMLFGSVCAVWAHAVPGSVLRFSNEDGQLILQMQVSVEDLLVAAPQLGFVAQEPQDSALPPQMRAQIAGYILAHMAVFKAETALDLTLDQALLSQESDPHAGAFLALKLRWIGALPEGLEAAETLPLRLHYDVILHELRSHRAVVYWQAEEGATPQGLARFGYQSRDGVLLEP